MTMLEAVKKFVAKKKVVITSVLLGQVLSVFICGTAISSGFLTQMNVNIPLTQSFFNYLFLALTYSIYFIYTRNGNLWETVKSRGWIYLIAALIDVEANYAIVKAYQYTSVTSVQLLDCMTIPTVVACSLIVFSLRYLCLHYVAVGLCLSGAISMVLVDHFFNSTSFTNSTNPLLGDVLVVVGAILYGISNVCQDYLVKKHGQIEYLGFIGCLCVMISGIQISILERSDLQSVISIHSGDWHFWLSLAGFVLSMYLLYSLMPYVMRISSSVVTNLSLLTADVYALFAGIFLFDNRFHYLYFIAYALIMVGVGLFVSREPVTVGEALPIDVCPLSCCRRRAPVPAAEVEASLV